MLISRVKRFLLGQPLTNEMITHESITKTKALAVFSSDALSSVAYATEEILIPLAAFSISATVWSLPIAVAIAILLTIVTLSYLQTIDHYPNGGGAYIVAKENLGTLPGLTAGAALMIDYVLTVAVSVAAGVENIVSAFPSLYPVHTQLAVLIILIVTTINLRGIRESASVFAFPTYGFIFAVITLLCIGFLKTYVETSTTESIFTGLQEYPELSLFLILRAFASGCSALTGIEAISNGVPVFRDPKRKNAKITLMWMSFILCTFFIGLTFLSHHFGIIPKKNETVISQLASAIFGRSFFYYIFQIVVAFILLLAANTSFAGFPRLCSLLANDRYLPRQLKSVGDRLVFSNGIIGLSFAAILLIVLIGAKAHSLIPLYAVGVFISFTLSQAGMVMHHIRAKEPRWFLSLLLNAVGAFITFIVFIVIARTKFAHGAYLVLIVIPIMVWAFTRIQRHYLDVAKELSLEGKEAIARLQPIKHKVVIPVSGIHPGVLLALRYAVSISDDVEGVYVDLDDRSTERFVREWKKWAGNIPLKVLNTPYRSILSPLLSYIDTVRKNHDKEMLTVLLPEFITAKWWHEILHNQTAFQIRTALLFKRNTVVTSVRHHLHKT